MAGYRESLRVVRVVAVSPGDVLGERDGLQAFIDELNLKIAPSRGCRVSLWRWETDAGPGLDLLGPQGLIDKAMRIEDADVVVGVFWKRFGTPTHRSLRAPADDLGGASAVVEAKPEGPPENATPAS